MQVSDEMQQQAKALADPSRFRLFRHIVETERTVDVAELTELLGFNHNAIRQHLAVLVEAGLVAESNERRKVRGRPRKEYRARLDALSAFRSVSGSYQRLAELLVTLVATEQTPYEVGFAAAMEATDTPHTDTPPTGTRLDNAPDTPQTELSTAMADLMAQLTAAGFEPVVDGEAETILGHCPFADVASDAPGVVCELHHGLIDGQLARMGGQLRSELVPQDPQQAGCRITIGPTQRTTET